MRLGKIGSALAVASLLVSNAAFAADATRAGSAMVSAKPRVKYVSVPARVSTKVENGNSLVGLPLWLLALAGVAAVTSIVVVATDDDSPSSPG